MSSSSYNNNNNNNNNNLLLLWAYVCRPGECSPYIPSHVQVYSINCVF